MIKWLTDHFNHPALPVWLLGLAISTSPASPKEQFKGPALDGGEPPYHVTVAEKGRLQELLNRYRAVVLDADVDYRSASHPTLQVSTGMSIVGGWNTRVPVLELAPGSSNIVIDDIRSDAAKGADVVFLPGDPIKDVSITGGSGGIGTNVRIEIRDGARVDHLTVNDYGGLKVAQAGSGYVRNSSFARLLGYWPGPQIDWTGNSAEGSYANAFLGISSITPGQASRWYQPGKLWVVNADCESWNMHGEGDADCFRVQLAKSVVVVSLSGGTAFPDLAGAILSLHQVDEFLGWFFHGQGGARDHADLHLDNVKTAAFLVTDPVTRILDKHSLRPDTRLISSIADPLHVGAQSEPQVEDLHHLFAADTAPLKRNKPILRQASEPQVASASELGLMADSSGELQKRIDADGVVKLAPGVYYLDRPLRIGSRARTEGLLGSLTGDVVLVPKGDFAAIQGRGDIVIAPAAEGVIVSLAFDHLIFSGGSKGIDWSSAPGNLGPGATVAFSRFSRLRFLHQRTAAVDVKDIRGLDSNSWVHDDFVDVPYAFRGAGHGVVGPMTYADKQAFIDCQFSRIRSAVWAWSSDRPSGGELWQDCYFQDVNRLTQTLSAISLLWSNSVMENVYGDVALHVLDVGGTATAYFILYDCLWRGTGPKVVSDSLSFGLGTLFVATRFEQSGGSIVSPAGSQTVFEMDSEMAASTALGHVAQGVLIRSKAGPNREIFDLLRNGRVERPVELP